MKTIRSIFLIIGAFLVLSGFNLENSIVPKEEILSGGPPKDGIPAIMNPVFVKPDQAAFLKPDDKIIGVKSAGESRAYPIKILNWHEVVNDTIGKMPIAVSF